MDNLQKRIEETLYGFQETKAAYALPDSTVDIGEMYYHAGKLEQLIRDMAARIGELENKINHSAQMMVNNISGFEEINTKCIALETECQKLREAQEWRDIDSCPEGEYVLVYAGKARKVPTIWIAWREGSSFATQDDDVLYEKALTHWMPLPASPTQAQENG